MTTQPIVVDPGQVQPVSQQPQSSSQPLVVDSADVQAVPSGDSAMQGLKEGASDLLNIPNGIVHMVLHPIDTLRDDNAARQAANERFGQDWHVDKARALSDVIDALVPFLGPMDQAYLKEKNDEGKPTAAAVRATMNILPMLIDPESIGGKLPGFEEAQAVRQAMQSVKQAGRGNPVASALTDVSKDSGVQIPLSSGIRNGGLQALGELLSKRAANLRGEQLPSDVLINEGLKEASGQLASKLSNTANPSEWSNAISDMRNQLGSNVRAVEDQIRQRNLAVPTERLQAVQARASELANQLQQPGSDYNLPNLAGGARARALDILRNFAEPQKLISSDSPYTAGRVSVPKVMQVNDMLNKLDQLQELTGPVADSVADGALMQLKNSLKQAIRQTVGSEQSEAWDTANRNYASMMDTLRKTVAGKVYKSATPSQLADTLLSPNGSAIENVGSLQSALGSKFPQVQRALWERMMQKSIAPDGIIDADKLATQWNRLGKAKQQAWFGQQATALDRFVNATKLSGVRPLDSLTGVEGAAPTMQGVLRTADNSHSVFGFGRGLALELGNHAVVNLSPRMISTILNTQRGAQVLGDYMRAGVGTAARRGAANQLLVIAQQQDGQVH